MKYKIYTNDEKNYGLSDYKKIKALFDKKITIRQIQEIYKSLEVNRKKEGILWWKKILLLSF